MEDALPASPPTRDEATEEPLQQSVSKHFPSGDDVSCKSPEVESEIGDGRSASDATDALEDTVQSSIVTQAQHIYRTIPSASTVISSRLDGMDAETTLQSLTPIEGELVKLSDVQLTTSVSKGVEEEQKRLASSSPSHDQEIVTQHPAAQSL